MKGHGRATVLELARLRATGTETATQKKSATATCLFKQAKI
jgi:hypothetical protein